jgi:hypothetical protein
VTGGPVVLDLQETVLVELASKAGKWILGETAPEYGLERR